MNDHCIACGRRLPDERDEDGYMVFEHMCEECNDAQDSHYRDGLAS